MRSVGRFLQPTRSECKILVCEVHTWLVATLGKTTIASTVEEYLLGRG
jgi:hypothetical protein